MRYFLYCGYKIDLIYPVKPCLEALTREYYGIYVVYILARTAVTPVFPTPLRPLILSNQFQLNDVWNLLLEDYPSLSLSSSPSAPLSLSLSHTHTLSLSLTLLLGLVVSTPWIIKKMGLDFYAYRVTEK